MKKTLITIAVILGVLGLIAAVLMKNKKENEAKTAIVSLSESTTSVTTETVEKKVMNLDLTSSGSLTANQDLQLLSEVNGRITQIKVKEGSRVAKGQVLAIVDAEALNLDVKIAQDNYQKLQTDYERYASSYETGGVTEAQFDEIKLALGNAKTNLQHAQKRINDAAIKSPISGVINQRFIEVGSFVSPGTNLFEIVEASSLKLKVTVNEYQVINVKIGDPITVVVNVFPDTELEGRVSFISEKANSSLNYPIEIELKNLKNLPIKPGMYATAQFEFPDLEPQIFISRNAFVGGVNSNLVYVLDKNNQTANQRRITSGRIIGDYVEVINGLEVGEEIITSGHINLNDGVEVEVVK